MPKKKGSPWQVSNDKVTKFVEFTEDTCDRLLFLQNIGTAGNIVGLLGAEAHDETMLIATEFEFVIPVGGFLILDKVPKGFVFLLCDAAVTTKNVAGHASWKTMESD